MNLKDFFQMFKILEFVSSNPNCTAPEIRDFLGIIHYTTPSPDEKKFYYILNKLEKEGYIYRVYIKKIGSAGPQFSLTISAKGAELVSQLKQFSALGIKEKKPYPEKKSKKIMLDSMVKVFVSEAATEILERVQEIIAVLYPIHIGLERKEMTKEEIFENITTIEQQKTIVNMINDLVNVLGVKTGEIANSFI